MAAVSRRGFIVTIGAFAALLATGGGADALADNRSFLRPPGASSDTEFLARCIRCQKCTSVCHSRVIQPISVTDSIKSTSTPTVDFTRNYCDFCAETNEGSPRCAEVCPTGALTVQRGKPAINGIAVINEGSCVAWDWKGCTVCVEECPQDAISLDGKRRPVVDEGLCNGCGLCELICPSASLRSYGESRSEAKGIAVVPNGGGI